MIAKLKPKVFSEEQLQAIKKESATQTTFNEVQKSTDPENFPVFDIPINGKVLVYVPNHVVVNDENVEELRMDKPWIHTVLDGKRFLKFRCIKNLSEEAGYSGECPLCNGTDEPWALANEMIKEACASRDLNVTDSDDEAVKSIKSNAYGKRVIKSPDRYYTFPITVIETENNEGKKIILDADGSPKRRTFWYTISEAAYNKKWGKTLESMEDEPTHPGGNCFILNYTYESKSGEYNKRDSAKELAVSSKKIKDFGDIAAAIDKETEHWTPEKAIEVITDNMYYEEVDLQEVANQALEGTREKLAIYESVASVGKGSTQFIGEKLEPAKVSDNPADALPMAGSTDED